MTSARSRRLWLATLAFLALGGAAACGKKDTPPPAVRSTGEATAPVRVAVAAVESRATPRTLVLTGTLLADAQSNVTPIVAGRVTQVFVERGQVVEEGAPLIKLRDVDYRLANDNARAMYEQARSRLGVTTGAPRVTPEDIADVRAAQANMELANSTLERSQRLLSEGALSQSEFDRAQAAATGAQEQYRSALNGARGALAALESARVAVEQTGNALRDSIVRAPFAGEIASRLVNVGEFVSAQAPVVTLVKTNPLRLELQIPQEQISAVRQGQRVEIRVDAFPDRVFTGEVRYISASVQQATRGLIVESEVQNADGALRPGLFANARLLLEDTQTLFAVPRTAVREEAGVARAFIVKDGQIDERVVTIADRQGDTILLRAGVAAGEQIATSALDQLADGVRVTQ